MVPELHRPVLDEDVWAVVSLLVHVTDVPCLTMTGFGENAVLLRSEEFRTMLADVVVVDVELGAIVDVDVLLLHAAAARRLAVNPAATRMFRRAML